MKNTILGEEEIMKKILAVFCALFLMASLASCNDSKVAPAMSYTEFMAAAQGDNVVVEGFIAAKQSWWDGKVTMYLVTDTAGEGFFIYEFRCTEEENNTIYAVNKFIRIEATKTIYAGEHEIMGDSITKVESPTTTKFMSTTPIDLTAKLDDLASYQNSFFTATLKVKEYTAPDINTGVAESKAYGYKGDEPTDDLYFTLTDGTKDLNCCIEAYLTSKNTDVYAAVQSLEVGQTIIVQGYLYFWNNANPHITSVLPSVLDYATYMDAPKGEVVSVEGFVSAKQAWWNGQVIVYLTTSVPGEGYFLYNVSCSKEESDTDLVIGSYIRARGTKEIYAGEHELIGVTYTVVNTIKRPASTIDLTDKISDLSAYQNSYFTMTLTVKKYETTDSNATVAASEAFGYKGDAPTDDLYFTLTDGTTDIACCIESYLTNSSTSVYAAVQALAVGDSVTVTGYLYWWNGPNPHIVSLSVNQ